jgi:hypothetical protein
MERVGKKSIGFEEAARYDREQSQRMTPDERRRVAKALRDRVYGTNCPDVRDFFAGARRRRRTRP